MWLAMGKRVSADHHCDQARNLHERIRFLPDRAFALHGEKPQRLACNAQGNAFSGAVTLLA